MSSLKWLSTFVRNGLSKVPSKELSWLVSQRGPATTGLSCMSLGSNTSIYSDLSSLHILDNFTLMYFGSQ